MFREDLFKLIKQRKSKIDNLIIGIENKLLNMPKGRIRISRNNGLTYYYQIMSPSDHNGEKINPDDTNLIRQLIQKNYLQKVLATAKEEKKAIDGFINRFPEVAVEEVYDTFSEDRRNMITPIYPNPDEYADEWQNTPYEGKPIEEGVYTFTTLKGEHVRSKSEKIIADALAMNGIPYRYECPLVIGKTVIHPDFTVLKKSNMKIYYWEHCGKSDDPDYYSNHIVKRIISEVKGVNRVLYDLSPKPVATIEFE